MVSDMDKITYKDLVAVYGKERAYQTLLSVESVANIEQPCATNEELRFERALEAITQFNFAS